MTSLAVTHARFQLIETFRIPMALIGSAFFPAASMIFFVVPFVGSDPTYATFATASMVTFVVMTSNLFQYGIGVAEDRAQPWDPYARTLPVGAAPRFAGRILAGLVMMAASLLPVVVIAALLTEATITVVGFLAALVVVTLIAVPFTLMGLAIGYSLPAKGAIVLAQVLFIPLAFGGGLMTAPGSAPGFVETIAPYLPPAPRCGSCGRRSATFHWSRHRSPPWSAGPSPSLGWPYGPIDATKVGGSVELPTEQPRTSHRGVTIHLSSAVTSRSRS